MTPANRLKKQVQDRSDWCECGNGQDRSTRISIDTTSGRYDVLEHHFTIWFCEECDGIVDVIGDRMVMRPMTQREMFERSFMRPRNFFKLSPKEQWAIDKELGILDWEGKDLTEEDKKRFGDHYM